MKKVKEVFEKEIRKDMQRKGIKQVCGSVDEPDTIACGCIDIIEEGLDELAGDDPDLKEEVQKAFLRGFMNE